MSPKKKKKEPRFLRNKKEKLAETEKFLRFDKNVNWDIVANTLANKKRLGDCIEFLKSETFWDIILKMYNDYCPDEEFNRFFWTMKSMYTPLISVLQTEGVEADLYHSVSTGYAGLLGMTYSRKHNKPFLLTEHGIYAREREEEIIKANWVEGIYKKIWIDFFYFMSVGAYKSADMIVSLFARNREIQIELGADPDKAIVVPNGVDPNKFKVVHEQHEGKNIGAILRIVPIKDVKTLIRAFKVVKMRMPETKLFLIGPHYEDTSYHRECKNLVATLGLDESVIFTGRADVREYMKILDLLVLTSLSEGQPLVILEAMAAEIPFVATDVGACRELLEGSGEEDTGAAGIITKPVSPNETAMAIMKLLKDDELSHAMRQNARRRVEKYYRKDMFIGRYKKMYDHLLVDSLSDYKTVQKDYPTKGAFKTLQA